MAPPSTVASTSTLAPIASVPSTFVSASSETSRPSTTIEELVGIAVIVPSNSNWRPS